MASNAGEFILSCTDARPYGFNREYVTRADSLETGLRRFVAVLEGIDSLSALEVALNAGEVIIRKPEEV